MTNDEERTKSPCEAAALNLCDALIASHSDEDRAAIEACAAELREVLLRHGRASAFALTLVSLEMAIAVLAEWP